MLCPKFHFLVGRPFLDLNVAFVKDNVGFYRLETIDSILKFVAGKCDR